MSIEKMTLSIPEVCDTLGISRNGGYALARRGELPIPVIKLGKRLVVSKAAIEKLLQQTN